MEEVDDTWLEAMTRDLSNLQKRFLFLVALFISAKASIIAIHSATLVIACLITFCFFIYINQRIDFSFVTFSILFACLTCFYLFKFGYLDIRTGLEYIKFLYAYLLIKILWRDFFKLFTNLYS